MNELIIAGKAAPVTMTSREISELVEKRHDGVKRSIERLADKGVISPPVLAEGKKSANGILERLCLLNKRDSYIVVAQMAPAAIGAVVDAWGRTQESLAELLSALEAFDVPDDVVGVYVYAIREVETGHIKLGISRDPVERVRQLQTANSSKLELVAYRKADNGFADEHAAHSSASAHHIRGEWFAAEALEVLK